jgi:hypothetical protein
MIEKEFDCYLSVPGMKIGFRFLVGVLMIDVVTVVLF